MSRTYPVGYSIQIHVTNYRNGPWLRLTLTEEDGASPQRLTGFLDHEALVDIEALAYALLHETQGPLDHTDPF